MQTINLQQVPSPIDATAPISTAKETYGFISTRKVIDLLEAKGWEVDEIHTNKVRVPHREGFQRHLVWFRHPTLSKIEGLSKNNESLMRFGLSNAHDMTTAYQLFCGLLRILCLNQIAAGNVFRHFRASHSKNVVSRLNEGIEFMTDGLPEMIEQIKRLQQMTMTVDQRLAYAKLLVDMRLENVQNVVKVDYSVTERALRAGDEQQDAYTVMNRVQEYVIRGGIPYTYEKQVKNDAGEVVSRSNVSTVTRKLASIPSQMKLNQALMAEIYKVA